MASHQGTVNLTQDNIERQARCTPERALEELIWNAMDAGGPRVEVRFETDDLQSVSAVEVIDRGSGISFCDKERAFGSIGDSPKLLTKATPDGRALHGSEGRGRFKALVLGTHAVWSTVFQQKDERLRYSISIRRDNQKVYAFSDPIPTTESLGTRLRIDGVDSGQQSLRSSATRDAIVARFALYIKRYPNVELVFDGSKVDPSDLIAHSEVNDLLANAYDRKIGEIEIVEWRFDLDSKKLYLCDMEGFTWHEMPAGVQLPGLNVSAYVRWPTAKQFHQDNRMALGEVDPDIATITEAAKNALREFRRRRLSEQAQTVVEQWKRERVYPYPDEEPQSVIERAERQVFDIVATRVHEFHEPLRRGESSAKRLTLELVRQALESDASSLRRILERAIHLPVERQEELAELLELTSFEALIDSAKTVAQRLDVVHGFESLVFDPDWKRRLRERTQLHRLLVHELWIFGEEYTLDSDDAPWKRYLEKHVATLGRSELAPTIDESSIDGIDKIPDLLLSRRFVRRPNTFENLVIELKRPSVKIGLTEITQIEEYAGMVAEEDAFDKKHYKWRFVLIGNALDRHAERRATQEHLPPGCVSQSGNVSVWVMRWSEVFAEAKMRYEFFRDRLEIEASAARGLRYLNENYAHLLAGKGMSRRGELTAGLLQPE